MQNGNRRVLHMDSKHSTTLAATPDADEALRRTVATPAITPRRLIAAGIKRGNGRLVVQAVAA